MNIAIVAAQTGLTKEVIRKWESRYGFPVPDRDAAGNRLFTQAQVLRLQMIKTLLDRGMRPGRVVALCADDLAALVAAPNPMDMGLAPDIAAALVSATRAEQPRAIRDFFAEHVDRLGLSGFVRVLLPSMIVYIGHAWANAEIGICNEHAFTEAVKSLLHERLDRVTTPARGPRVLLTTPAGESHTLGLLMAEVILTLEGAECIGLGPNLSADEIVLAAAQYRIDIVGLSVSDAYPVRMLAAFIHSLRRQLPDPVAIWAGGTACKRLPSRPSGVDLMPTLESAIDGMRAFRVRSGMTPDLPEPAQHAQPAEHAQPAGHAQQPAHGSKQPG